MRLFLILAPETFLEPYKRPLFDPIESANLFSDLMDATLVDLLARDESLSAVGQFSQSIPHSLSNYVGQDLTRGRASPQVFHLLIPMLQIYDQSLIASTQLEVTPEFQTNLYQ
jgi:hypothetical protein